MACNLRTARSAAEEQGGLRIRRRPPQSVQHVTAIDAAPYYAVRIYVCTGGTIAGVKTNLDFQVLREDGSVINGLYAGGETSNREMYAYAYSSGSGVGYALASGRQIGIHLMK